MKTVNILFPHQLFQEHELLTNGYALYLIEEQLFFNHFNFHKQKLVFHRASMKCYADYLRKKEVKLHYVEAIEKHSDVRVLFEELKSKGVDKVHYINPTDNWLERRIQTSADRCKIELEEHENPLFLNTRTELSSFFKPVKKKFFQTSFYKEQRVKRALLLDEEGKPEGGKWSFDGDNRKKYPKGKEAPSIHFPEKDQYYTEARKYVEKNYPNNLGELSDYPLYTYTYEGVEQWLDQFLNFRFHDFGAYEDAIVKEETILHHSVLTPMLNVGLISPQVIIDKAILFAKENNVPLNSLEGFVRQIIGWREFIRGMYECKGVASRTTNFWKFKRKIPPSFYDGTTGITPVDVTIKRVLKEGYCHHIERLMVLGNFMMLCEFDPDEVYRWFMELFIDAYDWVMVPNVYGMSQFADGGFFATKPYISGSNYIIKISNYKKGEWQEVWDALFWRFMSVHRDFFLKNPRLGMLVRSFDKMPQEKQHSLIERAEDYLQQFELK